MKELNKQVRKFICYYHLVGFYNISLGISINFSLPNIEIHLPFGFIRIGFTKVFIDETIIRSEYNKRTFGKVIK